jgi:hypothetical protein
MTKKESEEDFVQRAQNSFASFFDKDEQNMLYYLHTKGYLEALHDSLVKELERRFQTAADKEMLFQQWKRCNYLPLLGNWNITVGWYRKTPTLAPNLDPPLALRLLDSPPPLLDSPLPYPPSLLVTSPTVVDFVSFEEADKEDGRLYLQENNFDYVEEDDITDDDEWPTDYLFSESPFSTPSIPSPIASESCSSSSTLSISSGSFPTDIIEVFKDTPDVIESSLGHDPPIISHLSTPIPTYPPSSHYYSHGASILSLSPHLSPPILAIPPHPLSLVKTWLCPLGSDPPFGFLHSFTHGCHCCLHDVLGVISIDVTYDSDSGMYTYPVSVFPLSGSYTKFYPHGIAVAVLLPPVCSFPSLLF